MGGATVSIPDHYAGWYKTICDENKVEPGHLGSFVDKLRGQLTQAEKNEQAATQEFKQIRDHIPFMFLNGEPSTLTAVQRLHKDWSRLYGDANQHAAQLATLNESWRTQAETIKGLKDALAQALVEKNEALEARGYKQAELEARNKTLSDLYKQLDTERARQHNLSQEVRELRSELAALRPPEPKFKVNQVVVVKPAILADCRRDMGFVHSTEMHEGKRRYWINLVQSRDRVWYFETSLRPLTPEEKGEQS